MSSSTATAPATSATAPAAPKTMQQTIAENRAALKKAYTAVKPKCQSKWQSLSPAARSALLKRCHDAVLALVQTNVPKKQWAQWLVTVKFCLNDVFEAARATSDKEYVAVAALIEKIVGDGESQKEREDFEKRVAEMLAQMAPGQVPGFDAKDTTHAKTLYDIRCVYAVEWAQYMIKKLAATDS